MRVAFRKQISIDVGLIFRLEKVLDAKRMKTDHPVRTPPYKIDYPDIAVRDLIPRDGTQLRFLIFGTDGRE